MQIYMKEIQKIKNLLWMLHVIINKIKIILVFTNILLSFFRHWIQVYYSLEI